MKDVTHLPRDLEAEPAVRNPELARLVELARRQPPPRLTVDADRVHVAWKEQRARRWRSVALVAAAGLVAWLATSLVHDVRQDPEPSLTADNALRAPAPMESGAVTAASTGTAPAADVEAEDAEPEVLAPGIRVEPRSDDAAHVVLGPWSVEVAAGVYEMAAPIEAVSSLHVRVGTRTLVVEPGGVVHIEGGARPEATLLSGEAAWVDREGRPTPLSRHAGESGPVSRAEASALARKAERLMAAGDRKGAIAAYRTLVRKHPRSTAARAGLLDLARLLKAAGDENGARCAYEKLLERWPDTHLRPEIERELRRMRPGPTCSQP